MYKIAARWSDGVVAELKTYGLCCATCLPDWFRRGRARQQATRLLAGEILEPCGIYALQRGVRDQQLERLSALEQQLAASA
ncbi:MAG: hypothetical protein NZO58_05590 [Gemmataceae bacterium]|nr:hypothetical protein [Gemmataceae bacterium]